MKCFKFENLLNQGKGYHGNQIKNNWKENNKFTKIEGKVLYIYKVQTLCRKEFC